MIKTANTVGKLWCLLMTLEIIISRIKESQGETQKTIPSAKDFPLHKCCSAEQVLQVKTGFRCADFKEYYTYSTDNDSVPKWVPEDTLVVADDNPASLRAFLSKNGISPKYTTGIPCSGRQWHLIFASDVDSYSLTDKGDIVLHDEDEGDNSTFPSSAFCFDRLLLHGKATVDVILLCPCQHRVCVRKCCSKRRMLSTGPHGESKCVDDDLYQDSDEQTDASVNRSVGWTPTFMSEDGKPAPMHFQIFGHPVCPGGTALELNPPGKPPLRFWLQEDGSAIRESYTEPIPAGKFCWDTRLGTNGSRVPELVFCGKGLVAPGRSIRNLLYGILLLVDAAFLLATLLIYAILPELRITIHAKNLVAHTGAFLVGYVFLAIGQFFPYLSTNLCTALAFVIQYAFLAAMFWLNVMCIDITWTFSGLRSPQGSALERDRKKYLYYSLYAWGTTAVISIVTALMEFVPNLMTNSALKPNFGYRRCWFYKPVATFTYFYGPMAFLLGINLVLFLYTATKIISVQRDTAILNNAGSANSHQKDKQRLVLYMKLFCLMGLTWVMEIISWAAGGADYYWYVTDAVNMLRAIFIFIIFCCKRTVLLLLRAKMRTWFPCWCARKITRTRGGKGLSLTSLPTSSLRLSYITSFKKSSRRPSQETQPA